MEVLIIEDEWLSAERLIKLLIEYDPGIKIIKTLQSVEETINWLSENSSPDLILMDIHLEDDHCFKIFETINVDTPIIFTTAYDEYTIKAFKVNSIDYLLKPIEKEELNEALDKLKRIRLNTVHKIENLIQSAYKTTVQEYKKRFLVSAGTKLKSIEIIDISYFYYVDRISFLVTTDGQKFPISFSLDKLESMLNPEDFFRVNRQFMVKHQSIRQIQLYPKGRIKIDLTPECREEVLISIDRITAFKDWLGK